jgi:hypothetical protein
LGEKKELTCGSRLSVRERREKDTDSVFLTGRGWLLLLGWLGGDLGQLVPGSAQWLPLFFLFWFFSYFSVLYLLQTLFKPGQTKF